MIEIKTIVNYSKQESFREFYVHPKGLQEAIRALREYRKGVSKNFGACFLKVDGVHVCDDEIDDFFSGQEVTVNLCETFLQSKSDDMLKQSRMGQKDVLEIREKEVDRGFLQGYFGGCKTKSNPHYNKGFQSGVRCAAREV